MRLTAHRCSGDEQDCVSRASAPRHYNRLRAQAWRIQADWDSVDRRPGTRIGLRSINMARGKNTVMSSLNFIGGEKGGVGKSVVARALAQYFIDSNRPFVGFDTDRSHNTFSRFYADFASPVIVDSYQGLDQVVSCFDLESNESIQSSVIVDLAAQTAAPLDRWMKDSDVLPLMSELGVTVNYWHLADAGKDSVDLLGRLLRTHGERPNYIVVRNLGRGSDFTLLDQSPELAQARTQGAHVISLPELHESSMRKIDHHDLSFWSAVNVRGTETALGMLERQRVKAWLRSVYALFDDLPL